eukprot:ctg_938.g379
MGAAQRYAASGGVCVCVSVVMVVVGYRGTSGAGEVRW